MFAQSNGVCFGDSRAALFCDATYSLYSTAR